MAGSWLVVGWRLGGSWLAVGGQLAGLEADALFTGCAMIAQAIRLALRDVCASHEWMVLGDAVDLILKCS